MIFELEVGGLGSIARPHKIDFRVTKTTPDNPSRYFPLPDGRRVPAVIAFFGANASGKSTVLSSLMLLKDIATDRVHKDDGRISVQFSHCANAKDEIHLSSSFTADWIGQKTASFKYEVFLLKAGTFDAKIRSEFLYLIDGTKKKEILWRENEKVNVDFEMSGLPKELNSALKKAKIPSDTSMFEFLTLFGSKNIAKKAVSDVLRSVHSNLSSNRYREGETWSKIIDIYQNDEMVFRRLQRLIRRIDVGISNTEVFETASSFEQEKRRKFLIFNHQGFSDPIIHFMESRGTQNFIKIFPFVARALEHGGVAVLDEIDSDLHPSLLKEIVSWFHDPSENTENAQLIITCNNASLLHYLEKDEVFITEKNSMGCTTIYGLKDVHGVDRRENFYKKYLSGEYGGIPNFG